MSQEVTLIIKDIESEHSKKPNKRMFETFETAWVVLQQKGQTPTAFFKRRLANF